MTVDLYVVAVTIEPDGSVDLEFGPEEDTWTR